MSEFTDDNSFVKNAEESYSYSKTADGVLRFEVRGGDFYDNPLAPPELDDEAQGKNRSELTSLKHMQFERKFTLEYDFLIESGAQNTAAWMLLTQFHQYEDINPDGSLKDSGLASPPFAVQMRGERMEISARTDPNAVTQATPPRLTQPGYDGAGVETMYLDTNPVARDTWINLKIEIVFDWDPAGAGMLKVTRDGVVLVDYEGPIGYNDQIGPYLQMGVYREAVDETFAVQFRNVQYFGDGTPPPINGTAGDDDIQATLIGFFEDEELNGYAGNDTLNGGVGADTMNGGAGNDEYIVENLGDVVNERSGGVDQGGHDIVKSTVTWTLNADIEDLRLQGTENINGTGNAKANVLQGNDANNIIYGLGGNDSIQAADGADNVIAGDGNDTAAGGLGNDTVYGNAGNDEIYGNEGNDTLYGGDGQDTLYGGTGADVMDGGTGDDVYEVDNVGDVVSEGVDSGTDTVRASVSYDIGVGSEVEVLQTDDLLGTATINLLGSDSDNEIRGNNGANTLTGRGGNDLLQGYDGNDFMYGGAGDDTLNGGAGADTMSGNEGNDQYLVDNVGDQVLEFNGAGSDTVRATANFDAGATSEIEVINAFDVTVTTALNLSGSNTDNEIRGTNGVNVLVGRGGNDLIQAYLGNDTVDAGDGNDTVFAAEGDDSVLGGAGDDSIDGNQGRDTIAAGEGNDTVFGGTESDRINGGGGDDSLLGEAGNDTLFGEAGVDTLSGGDGNDSLLAGAGDDSLSGNDGDDTLIGDSGNDTLYGGAGRDSLEGGADDDVLYGEDGVDTLDGGAGNDILYSGGGATTGSGGEMRGGAGDDTYYVNAANMTIIETAGNGTDTVRTEFSVTLDTNAEVEVLRVDDANTTNAINLTGSNTANELRGNEGANILRGRGGDDTMRGFGGDDTYYVDSSNDVVIEAAGEGTDRILTTTSYTLSSTMSVETLEVTPSASLVDVTLVGNQFNNTLIGGHGDDSLVGNDGDDRLVGSDGDDTLLGGSGTDTVVLDVASTEVTATTGASSMSLQSLTGNDIISDDVEFIEFSDQTLTYAEASVLVTTIDLPSDLAGPDSLTGDADDNSLAGGGGEDTLRGLGGNDRLYGGDDFDTLEGGSGNDSLYSGVGDGNGAEMIGGLGDDVYFIDSSDSTVTETAGQGDDTARVSISYALGATDDIETLQVNDPTTTDDINLTGSNIANTLRGNDGNNILDGGAGNDTMIGYDGDDTYIVRDAGDAVSEGEGQGNDTIRTTVDLQLGSTQFIEVLRAFDPTSTAGLSLTGNDFDNEIHGTDGADSMVGNGGNDRLFLQDGDDTARGGDGVDEVVLDIASTAASGTARALDLVLQTANGTKIISDDVEKITFTDGTLTYEEAAQLISTVAIPGDLTGDNSLTGTAGNDVIYAGRGDDTVDALGGADVIYGNEGTDTLRGGDGNDTLFSGEGDGGELDGGAGNDLFYVDAENTAVTEAAAGGTDTVYTSVDIELAAGSEVERIYTQNYLGIDGLTMVGSNINNDIRGNQGNNMLDGRGGNDTMYGYGGDDVFYVDSAFDLTYETAGGGNDTVLTSIDRTLRSVDEIESLRAVNEESTTGLTLIGNSLANTIAGTDGADSLRGGDGDDTLIAHDGADTIYGDGGTDTLVVDENSTEVTGLIGGSLLAIYTASGKMLVHESTETIQFLDTTMTFAEVGTLISEVPVPGDPFGPEDTSGTPGDDNMSGLAGNDTLRGLAGNDVIQGGEGEDLLIGGEGNDTLYSGTSDNPDSGGEMRGGLGNDIYYVDAPKMKIVELAGEGTDTIYTNYSVTLDADDEIELLRALDLNSTNVINLIGSNSDQVMRGNAGGNVLDGRGGADNMYGYGGDDVYYVDNVGDVINEWTGNGFDVARTSINLTLSSVQYIERIEGLGTTGLTLQGNQLNNGINGTVGDDWLLGQDGDDTLVGTFGNDTLYGGDGEDRAVFEIASTQVTSTAGATSFTMSSSEGEDIIRNDVEYLVFTDTILTYAEASVLRATVDPTAPVIQGTENAEVIDGTDAAERIEARGGNDWIRPMLGNDTVDGGAGNDMIDFLSQQEVAGRRVVDYMLNLDLEEGLATLFSGEENVLLNIERVTGTIFADFIKGDSGANHIRGLGDYDWFIATEGNDTLDGGNGQDMLSLLEWGGTSAATLVDVFAFNGAPPSGAAVNGVVLDLADGSNNSGLAAGQTLISIERITGSSYQDVFYGDANQNDFRGLGGYDWFVGSSGGRERYYGGDGIDTMTYFQSTSGVIASLRNGAGTFNGQETGYGSGGDAARDLYFEIENLVGTNYDDRLEGNSERNQLAGLDGDDLIFGYGGIDRIMGGDGNDTIDGGAGSDYALYEGNLADYTITKSSSVAVTISGQGFTDTLTNVEYFEFADTTANIWEYSII